MITVRSIKLLSSVMLISTNRIKVLRLWLTCFEDWPIRILTFTWWMLKTRNTMVSWQAFSSLPPRAPLAFLSRLKLPFFPLSNACYRRLLERERKRFSYSSQAGEAPLFACLLVRPVFSSTSVTSYCHAAKSCSQIPHSNYFHKKFTSRIVEIKWPWI